MFEKLMKALTENSVMDGKLLLKNGTQTKNIDGRNIKTVEKAIEKSGKIRINLTVSIHDENGKANDVIIALGTVSYEEEQEDE